MAIHEEPLVSVHPSYTTARVSCYCVVMTARIRTHVKAHGPIEGENHATADEYLVTLANERFNDGYLGRHLTDGYEWQSK